MKLSSDPVPPRRRAAPSRRRALVLAAAGLALFALGALAERGGHLRSLWPWLGGDAIERLGRRLQGARASVPRLRLDLSPSSFGELERQREEALARGRIDAGRGDAVPATVWWEDEPLAARVRLKGDLVDHVLGDKWSLRVELEGPGAVLGLRRFALQDPARRNRVHEWLFHRALEREGLLALAYAFVEVSVGGREPGIYALEEHFDRPFFERRGLRRGVVLRLEESAAWAAWEAQGFDLDEDDFFVEGYFGAEPRPYGRRDVLDDPERRAHFTAAARRLDAFRRGTAPAREVFDVAKLARYFALTDLLGAQHAGAWYNLRFYWDPVEARLEPVGFDGDAGQLVRRLSYFDARASSPGNAAYYHVMLGQLFADPAVLAAYVAALERVAADGYLEALLEDLGDELEEQCRILYRDDLDHPFSPANYERNLALIRHYLDPPEPLELHARRAGDDGDGGDGGLELLAGNAHSLPLELLEVLVDGRPVAVEPPLGIHPPKLWRQPVTLLRYRAARAPDGPVELRYRLPGSRAVRTARPRPGESSGAWLGELEPGGEFPEAADAAELVQLAALPFVRLDPHGTLVEVLPGEHRLERDLRVPPGRRLVVLPGTTLELGPDASLISRSPVELLGRPEAPVRLVGDGGLAVIAAGGTSRLEHVRFEGLGAPARGDRPLSGAVTFQESPFELRHAEFTGVRAEDALNAIRSRYLLEDVRFEGCASDAFDADFSEGELTRCRFERSGGDAVDLAGGILRGRELAIVGAGDKGLSIGEGAAAELDAVELADCAIGAAVKDSAHALLRAAVFRGCEVGVAVYRKKPEYRPGTLVLEEPRFEGCGRETALEPGAVVVRDGEPVRAPPVDEWDSLRPLEALRTRDVDK